MYKTFPHELCLNQAAQTLEFQNCTYATVDRACEEVKWWSSTFKMLGYTIMTSFNKNLKYIDKSVVFYGKFILNRLLLSKSSAKFFLRFLRCLLSQLISWNIQKQNWLRAIFIYKFGSNFPTLTHLITNICKLGSWLKSRTLDNIGFGLPLGKTRWDHIMPISNLNNLSSRRIPRCIPSHNIRTVPVNTLKTTPPHLWYCRRSTHK